MHKQLIMIKDATEIKKMNKLKFQPSEKPLYLYDRRNMERYRLQKLKIVLELSEGTFREVNLVDISLNSIRFVAAFPLIEGQDIVTRFQFPQTKLFSMKGFTIRVEELPEPKSPFTIVVKFYPFSTYERYNLMENRKLIQKILSHGEVIYKDIISNSISSPLGGLITAA